MIYGRRKDLYGGERGGASRRSVRGERTYVEGKGGVVLDLNEEKGPIWRGEGASFRSE